jgi:hypothetical protein
MRPSALERVDSIGFIYHLRRHCPFNRKSMQLYDTELRLCFSLMQARPRPEASELILLQGSSSPLPYHSLEGDDDE